MKHENKKIVGYSTHPIWPNLPVTISWLRGQRDTIRPSDLQKLYFRRQGMNATIILLSATCLEGFLVECLSSFAMGNMFAPKDTFKGRLDHDFLRRVSTATFGEFPDLFRLTLGKAPSELIQNTKLMEGVQILIAFRNGIAHARSVHFQAYTENLEEEDEFEIGDQYRKIHNYLERQKLVAGRDDLFSNQIADHFASLVRPYMEAVVALLPVPQSDNVKDLVKSAWKTR
jgi:hypothetical protein